MQGDNFEKQRFQLNESIHLPRVKATIQLSKISTKQISTSSCTVVFQEWKLHQLNVGNTVSLYYICLHNFYTGYRDALEHEEW